MGLNLVRPRRLLALTIFSCSALTTTAQTLTPTSPSFGNWVVQTTSTPKAVVLSNTTTAPLAISIISVSGDFGQASTCPIAPATLAAGGSCKISVTFTPTALGVRTGTLTVSDNASNSPQTAQLSGTGVTPVGLSSSSLAFGNQLVNVSSAAKVLTVRNNQTVPLTIAGISTSGDFAQTSNCPLSPNTLAAKLSCTISVTFTPTALGTRTGILTVSDNAPNSPQTASLIGTGTVPVTLSPANLTFASQVISTTSTGKSVTLKNTQPVPLTIWGVSTSGDFAQTSTCPSSPNTLGAGASCTISVTFTPTALGTRTGTLTINDSASTSPQTAGLSGTGTLSGLLSIFVAPANPNLSIGNQQQFVATGIFSGGKTINISKFVSWSSSAPPVASVNSTGLARAITQGVATIAAAYGAISGATTITVATPYVTSISVIPDNTSVPVGASEQFTAVLIYSDGTVEETTNLVNWSSSSATVATVTNSGLARALAAGSVTITASAESVTGSTPLVVVQPSCAAAPPGLVGWWTGDGNTVDIAGNHPGTLENGATYGNGEVGQAFSLAGNGAAVLVNSPVYSPTAGTLMFWFMPTAAGSLTGSYDGINRTPGLAVDANGNLSWAFGNLSAQPLGQIAFNQWSHAAMTYSSSNSEVAVNVYLNGNLAASAIASQNSSWYPQFAIGAYLGAQKPSFTGLMDEVAIFDQPLSAQQIQQIYNAFSAGMCKPTLQSIAVTPASPSIALGLSQQFTATGTYSDNSTQDLTGAANWNSSNPNVASVSSTGLASALTAGTTTISATLLSVSGSTTLTTVAPPLLQSISVTPANPSVAIGQNQQFVATGLYADGSTQDLTSSVSWSSSQPAIAAITTAGLASGLGGGSSTITAALGTISATATLSVNPLALVSIAVTPGNASIALGTNQQFAATGTYADGSTLDLTTSATWSSSAPSVAPVNASGLATSASNGQTMITAGAASIGGSSPLTVTPAALVSIAITPAIPTIALGTTEQFAATGTFTDGSTQNITGSVQWDSSDGSVATISNAAGSQGLATSVATGSSSISATSGSISASTTLTVSIVALASITVNPASPSIALGTTQQFTATGTFTDGSTQDLTTSATWGSSNTVAATVSSSALGTSLATGTATITATLGGISGSTLLTVTPASVVSITVSPATAAIPLGLNQTFTAVGTFTDGSTQDVTNSAHWSSSVPSVATVSNTSGSSGMTTSTGSGSTVINATLGTVTGLGNLTVTTAILAAIEVNPQSPSIPIGDSRQFTATGLYTDGTTANITTSVTWASSSAAVATIGNTPGSLGLATSANPGTTIISATSGSLAGSTSLAVQDPLVAISVFPPIATIGPGANQQYSATGAYASGLINDVSGSVLWSSSSPAVATITASGLAMSAATGQTVITASVGSISGSATLAVLVAPIQHVVIIFQENRTPDNLFQDPVLISRGADIASSGMDSTGHTIPLKIASLNADYNPGHDHGSFNRMCHLNSVSGQCRMDGADLISVSCSAGATDCPAPHLQFGYVDPSQVQPYFQLAEQYTFADRMFQTNQGPSFPAHQFIISGTSAPSAGSNLFAAENPNISAGCDAPARSTVRLIDPAGKENSNAPIYPCFEYQTLTDLLEAKGHTWRYYTPSSPAIWTGPNAIQHICGPNAGPPNATACVGSDWINNVVLDQRKVLSDITTNQLRDVSWVVPSGQASDHPAGNDGSGPSWVASVVNAIGNSSYWANTAIFITWDDWGGWYDHVAPPQVLLNCAQWGCGYVYGFRVPLIVVSPYAKAQHISHKQHDFGSILKFIETTFSLPSLGKADVPADDLSDCFDFSQAPLPFQTIHAPLGPDFFLNDTRPPTDPDDD
jgi:trimeric autotransporter adhesin